ncbi:MAG: flagellar hook-length control protein FliK [Paracoccus denitrificans]|uniref:Flagellar hook-length control protein FliK n=1 Tax=Paracoccus denitrificans TaxID=266 RepID=A0A533I560_PARDE|nr:MAG: flagellar hook-length control protein FliK [Paracoccus denitrificans]
MDTRIISLSPAPKKSVGATEYGCDACAVDDFNALIRGQPTGFIAVTTKPEAPESTVGSAQPGNSSVDLGEDIDPTRFDAPSQDGGLTGVADCGVCIEFREIPQAEDYPDEAECQVVPLPDIGPVVFRGHVPDLRAAKDDAELWAGQVPTSGKFIAVGAPARVASSPALQPNSDYDANPAASFVDWPSRSMEQPSNTPTRFGQHALLENGTISARRTVINRLSGDQDPKPQTMPAGKPAPEAGTSPSLAGDRALVPSTAASLATNRIDDMTASTTAPSTHHPEELNAPQLNKVPANAIPGHIGATESAAASSIGVTRVRPELPRTGRREIDRPPHRSEPIPDPIRKSSKPDRRVASFTADVVQRPQSPSPTMQIAVAGVPGSHQPANVDRQQRDYFQLRANDKPLAGDDFPSLQLLFTADGSAELRGAGLRTIEAAGGWAELATVAPASAPPHSSATAASATRQLADAIIRTDTPAGQTELVLSPDDLGKVQFSIRNVEGQLSILITADRPETMNLLRRNADLLAAELAQSGMNSADLNFGGDTHGGNERPRNARGVTFATLHDTQATELPHDRADRMSRNAIAGGHLNIRL